MRRISSASSAAHTLRGSASVDAPTGGRASRNDAVSWLDAMQPVVSAVIESTTMASRDPGGRARRCALLVLVDRAAMANTLPRAPTTMPRQDQFGVESMWSFLERFLAPEPFGCTIQLWLWPVRVLANTIRFPLGAYDGWLCLPSPFVSRRGRPPSASISQTRRAPSRSLTNAIVPPSGEYAGAVDSPSSPVSLRSEPPVVVIVHTFVAPPRSLSNAIRVPSGDQAGAPSRAACSVRLAWAPPSASITKISASPVRVLLNAMRRPFGDHAGCVSSPAASVRRVRFEP